MVQISGVFCFLLRLVFFLKTFMDYCNMLCINAQYCDTSIFCLAGTLHSRFELFFGLMLISVWP